MSWRFLRAWLLLLSGSCALAGYAWGGQADSAVGLPRDFSRPPAAARPWVYWFWLNSNITRQGITADLEAMKSAGIGGVLIMEVDQGAPLGRVPFMGEKWRDLFHFMLAEAHRLGLEVNMNDDAGWDGSGGPWIKPAEAMQKVVSSETTLSGPASFKASLPHPETNHGYYRDVRVLAFPARGKFRIANLSDKALYSRGGIGPAAEAKLPAEMVIDPSQLVDLTARLQADGRLTWSVPAGQWTVLRIGHTCTGALNAPAPASGMGLECDKLSKDGIEAQFRGMMAKLVADSPSLAGNTLVATHIDSWENGMQNWTAAMPAEFQRRRGYDLLPYLPVFTGRVVQSLEVSERFLWDLRQTISELLVENYAGRMEQLAQQHGLRLSIEAYDGPCDDTPYAGRADEPMCEFWLGGSRFETCKEMASAAHTYGHRVVGAESFTAGDFERWHEHPATIKSLGDRAMCEGVNRFVFHRYAMQPWVTYKPGMAMGPWGLHYERTQTWWEMARPWHEYLARCHHMLRQGRFVADICYLQPEAAPQGFVGHDRHGYDFDNCTAEVVLTRMSVENGRLVLPDGMQYRVLALPQVTTMTPQLVAKIKQLVAAGALVIGPPPQKSPSLADYPHCDQAVQQVAAELWGPCDGKTVVEHVFGRGRVFWGRSPEDVLKKIGLAPDFLAPPEIRWIHRQTDDGTDIYFVASSSPQATMNACTFRVAGKRPEFWQPESGRIERVAAYEPVGDSTRIPIRLEPSGSVFVVFRPAAEPLDPVVQLSRNGKPLWLPAQLSAKIVVTKAAYGPPGDVPRTRDVRAKLQALVAAGQFRFQVARLADGDDPAFGVVKTLDAEYTVGGKPCHIRGQDPDEINLAAPPAAEHVAEIAYDAENHLLLRASQDGRYQLQTAAGRKFQGRVAALPPPQVLDGPWQVQFAGGGGPSTPITLKELVSWSTQDDPAVKYFSGTATYRKTFALPGESFAPGRHWHLDLGNVQVMAQVTLNGRDLGILWKPPYVVDITAAAKPGDNRLEVKVANLWINRLIGDEQLPEDSDRNGNGTLKAWPKWVEEGRPSPTGRVTFATWRLYHKGDPLVASGLLGPVTVGVRQELPLISLPETR